MTTIRAEDGFVLSDVVTAEFAFRQVAYDMLLEARKALPPGYRFLVFEAFRPRRRQWELWRAMEAEMRKRHPHAGPDEIYTMTREYVADPRGLGSGHQAGSAIDVSLVGPDGKEVDMGGRLDEANERTHTYSVYITDDQARNRAILVSALEGVGFVNYPSEWWHFSYGDRLWAELTKAPFAIFGPVEE